MSDNTTHELTVTINATDENPWHKMGLRCNPFPQLAKAEFAEGELRLAQLDADPIRDEGDLRQRLEGFTPEFVDACVRNYKPGARTKFTVAFPA